MEKLLESLRQIGNDLLSWLQQHVHHVHHEGARSGSYFLRHTGITAGEVIGAIEGRGRADPSIARRIAYRGREAGHVAVFNGLYGFKE